MFTAIDIMLIDLLIASSLSRIFHSYLNVTIIVEGLQKIRHMHNSYINLIKIRSFDPLLIDHFSSDLWAADQRI